MVQHANGRENLTPYSFGMLATEWLASEFPGQNHQPNSLLLYLNRLSAELTSEIETTILKPRGLSWSGYRFLFVLWIAGDLEPARIAELAQASRASISSLSTTFLAEGFILRRDSEVDRRSVLLSLTEKGTDKIMEAFLEVESLQISNFARLNETEQEILRLLLLKLMGYKSE